MFKITRVSSGIALAFGYAALTCSLPAAAQSSERVTIIGSNIKRVQSEAPTVVQVIRPSDIEKTGATTLNEVFLNIPGFSSYNDESAATSAPGRATVGFRNFDSSNILILVNGRRISRNAVNTSAYDLNSIPVAALERVEVLKDGAAAIYGSDAVAGVINFVLKRNFKGGSLYGGFGDVANKHDGTEKRVGGAYGFGDLDADGYNLLVTMDYLKRDVVMRRDRAPFAFRQGPGQYNEASPTGNIQSTSTGGKFMPVNACNEQLVTDAQGTYCPYYFNAQINLIPASERTGFFTSGSVKLGKDTIAFAEAMYTKNNVVNFFSAPPGRFTNVPIPAGGLTTSNGTVLPAGELALIRIRYDQSGVRTFVPKSTALRFLAGLEGTLGPVDYTVDIGKSTTKTDELSKGFFDYATARSDITAGIFNPFAVPTAAGISKYLVSGSTATESALEFVNARGSMGIGKLAGGEIGLAFGYSGAKESLSITPDAISASGRVSATGAPVNPLAKTSRTLNSVFAELSAPVLPGVETQAAIRYDKYSDFGSVTTPKVAAKWTVNPNFALRGSYSKGFIAPLLEYLYREGVESAEFVKDSALCAQEGVPLSACTTDQIDTTIQPNKTLKPERSTSFALGFVATPMPGMEVNVDWFSIKKTGRINNSVQYLIDNPNAIVAGRVASSYIKRTATTDGSLGAIESADSPYINTGNEQSVGVDIGVKYALPAFSWGKMTVGNDLTYYSKYSKAQSQGSPQLNYLGIMDQPRYRNLFTLNYDYQRFGASLYLRTMGGFIDASEPTDVAPNSLRVGAFSTTDIQVSYSDLLKKGSKVSIGVKNLFNKAPASTENDQNAGFPTSQSGLGRYLYMSFSTPF
ncbi:MAG TPA: TonB-dependent receptor [Aquabacterium sp.]|nr:TonB-dependent receptor [Aquabacterium sp.]